MAGSPPRDSSASRRRTASIPAISYASRCRPAPPPWRNNSGSAASSSSHSSSVAHLAARASASSSSSETACRLPLASGSSPWTPNRRRGTYPPRSVQGPDRRWHLLRRRLGRGNAPAPTTQPCPSVMPEHPTPGLPPCPVADKGGASTRTTCSPVRRPHASATGSVRKSPRNHATPLVCPRVAMREG